MLHVLPPARNILLRNRICGFIIVFVEFGWAALVAAGFAGPMRFGSEKNAEHIVATRPTVQIA